MSFFDDLRAELAAGLGPEVLEATLIRVSPGTRTAGHLGGGTNPTETSHACSGWIGSWDGSQIDGTIVRADDAVIGILGGTIDDDAVPEPGDKVIIGGKTWRIVGGREGRGVTAKGVGAGGLAAVYRCHGRRMP